MAKRNLWFDRRQVAEDFLDFLFQPEHVFRLQSSIVNGEGWDDVFQDVSPPNKAVARCERELPEDT